MPEPASRRWPSARLGAAIACLLIAAAACGTDDGPPSVGGKAYSGFIGASEFVVGENRFPFALVSVDGEELEDARVRVRFFSLEGRTAELVAEEPAEWRTIQGETPHAHPDGETHVHLDFRGVYVVDAVVLPHPGIWAAEFDLSGAYGDGPSVTSAAFNVSAGPTAPGVGERVPATENLTIHDVASFAELSTRAVEDDMHELSVAQALDSGNPFVVVFASPAFCVSAMCGPVTDTIAAVHERFRGRAAFIHIEPWDLEEARNEGRLVPAPVMDEWRLPSEPWTFVVGADGRVVKRFEGLVTGDEVAAALEPLL
ncbi:MAG: hypothetical protein IIC95_10010 [Chloroflexi bacterium]|nr:hypothetical protein [Chloroflexota bacterium]MCH7656295.1 hypothetical protein [Chloroflexota bacterium]